MSVATYRPPLVRMIRRVAAPVPLLAWIEALGVSLNFVWQVLVSMPFTVIHYRGRVSRAVKDLMWGRGSFIVGGGTAAVMVVMGAAVGASIGIEAYNALNLVALGELSGVISAFADTRELAPIAAGVGFAAQAGCRMTAEIGAMRISEEIDAIEALGLRSVPFVVTTKVIAGLVTIVPTFLLALIVSYLSSELMVTTVYGAPRGVYQHYFLQFIAAQDILFAVAKVTVFILAVIVIHCYHGFFATGGPEGVGRASGRAIRASLVAIIALDMFMTIILWGFESPLSFTG
ncbi:ABC transporter permease [Nocardia cyriacigeorgica]|uniref:ABC transporter permease n=1 Tax=Nocardia cyriacigeorgica TaxID=135487 RepID=UPI0024550FDF|nr:ABC transporter permease [Nocardia cyriacigeorgica]